MPKLTKTGAHGLYRDAKGRWCIDLRWKDPHTGAPKRHRERLPATLPAAAAKERARAILAGAKAGTFDPDRPESAKLRDAFKEYLDWCKTNRPNGIKKRTAAVNRLLKSLGDVRADGVSAFIVERFKIERAKGGAKPATVNRDLEVLSHAFGVLVTLGLAPESSAKAVRSVEHLREPPGRVRYLTPDEERRLMAALGKGGVRAIVTTALLTGMRLGELVSLRRDAVDLQGEVITLTRTKANKVRRVHINASLKDVLRAAMATGGGDYVFNSRRGKPYTGDGVRAVFRRAVTKAKIDNFRFHDLRHTTATRLRQHGAGIDVVADVLGHATLTMARRYAHLGAETMRAAMASLPPPAVSFSEAAPVAKAPARRLPNALPQGATAGTVAPPLPHPAEPMLRKAAG